MSRVLTLVGGVAAVGLAFATADWKPIDIAHGADANRRGRLEFRHETAVADAGGSEAPVEPGQPAVAPTQPDIPVQPETPIEPETPVEPEAPPAEPDVVSITDVTLAVVENASLPTFKVATCIQLQFDMEGLMFWVGASKRTEMNSQTHVFRNIGSLENRERALLIVPDEFTNWQYVKDTLATADKADSQAVYLGVADIENKTTLRVLRVVPCSPSDEAREGDFVIRVKEGDGGPAVQVNGEDIESFPTDLALAWNAWHKDNPDAVVALGPTSNVVVDAHRFTPTGYVAQVVGVLRGLGIECERFVGSTSYGGRKRK